jgi:hypothetical protein
VALVGTLVLFVLDLGGRAGPANEPFSGLVVEPARGGTRVGWRIPVRLP